jgi:hypothetical protein
MSVFKTILALTHNSINKCEIGHLGPIQSVNLFKQYCALRA